MQCLLVCSLKNEINWWFFLICIGIYSFFQYCCIVKHRWIILLLIFLSMQFRFFLGNATSFFLFFIYTEWLKHFFFFWRRDIINLLIIFFRCIVLICIKNTKWQNVFYVFLAVFFNLKEKNTNCVKSGLPVLPFLYIRNLSIRG